MDIRIGGKYKLGKMLGEGSFGAIFLGTNIKTNEEVAIKIVYLSPHNSLIGKTERQPSSSTYI